jgi:hypothetical protein
MEAGNLFFSVFQLVRLEHTSEKDAEDGLQTFERNWIQGFQLPEQRKRDKKSILCLLKSKKSARSVSIQKLPLKMTFGLCDKW